MRSLAVRILISDRFWQALGLIGLVGLVLFSLVACVPASQFLRGFEEEGLRQLRSGVSMELNAGLAKLPAPAPAPTSMDYGVAGSLGALVAYVLGSAGKGFIRGRLHKHEPET